MPWKKLLKYLVKSVSWVAGILAAIAVVCLIVLGAKIHQGPISLNFFKPYIDYFIPYTRKTITFNDAFLNWDKKQGRFIIQLEGVKVEEGKTRHTIAKIDQVDINLKISALLKGKFVPSKIAISKIYLHVFKELDGSFTVTSSLVDEKNSAEMTLDLQNLLLAYRDLRVLKPLKELRIVDSVIHVTHRETGKEWMIPKVEFVLNRPLNDIDIKAYLDLDVAKATLYTKAKIVETSKKISKVNLESQAILESLRFDDLAILWPQYLAPLPREWILAHLSQGHVPIAEATIKSTLDFGEGIPKLDLNNFDATVNFENMQVEYLKGLPAVTKVNGTACFDKKNILIKGNSGEVKNLKIKKSNIVINGVGKKDQDIAIDLEVMGPVLEGLQILEAPPLDLMHDFTIKPKHVKGSTTALLHFDFPLETTLTLDKVNIQASAKLNGLEIRNIFSTKESSINLTEGELVLDLNKSQMKTEGKAKINGVPVKLVWYEKFKQPRDWKSHYLIKADLEGHSLPSFGMSNIYKGVACLNLEYTQKDLKTSFLKADVDFTAATFEKSGLQFLKPQGQKCEGQVLIGFLNGKIRNIHDLKICGTSLDIQLGAKVNNDGSELKHIKSSKLKFGKTNLELSLEKQDSGIYSATVQGPILDVEPFIKDFGEDKASFNNLRFEVFFDIDSLHLGEGRDLRKVKGNASFQEGQWTHINCDSEISGRRKSQSGYLYISQEYKKKQGNILIKSDNAGEVLHLFGISDNTKDGILLIRAAKEAEGPWVGKAIIDQGFSLRQAPVMTRILAVASGFGLFDIFAGQAISFEKFRANFKWNKNQISVQDGRASGPSLGFTVAGLIDLKHKSCKLYGTVLPYNLFNMVLHKVPLIGSLLGGKSGGVFGVSYEVTGLYERPNVKVNPFSALTPGFLRKLFDPTEYEDFTEDTVEDKPKESKE